MRKLLKFLWPLIIRYRKWIYPFKVRIYQYRIYKNYKQFDSIYYRNWFILMFDDNFSQGGLVDRFKGVVSAYYLAKEFKIDLYIYFRYSTDPFINIINKSSVKILTNSNEICFSKRNSYPIVWYNYLPKNVFKSIKKIIKKKQVHFYTNMDLLPKIIQTEFEYQNEWAHNFKELFILNFEFNFNYFSAIKNQQVIGFHLRFIGLLGDFRDLRIPQVSLDYSENMIDWCVQKIIYISKFHSNSKFLVVSDSMIFLKYLIDQSKYTGLSQKIIIDAENIAHTAIVHDQVIFNKAYSDFLSLSMCHKVYQLKYGKMHKSDFSKYASICGMNEFILIDN